MSIKIRRANEKTDLQGILNCLASLSDVNGNWEQIEKGWRDRHYLINLYTYVAEDEGVEAAKDTYPISSLILGTASLFIMPKISHNGGKVGYLDDVAVLERYKGNGIGEALVNHIIKEAKLWNCYKLILDCKESLEKYYSRFGFRRTDIGMRLDLMEHSS